MPKELVVQIECTSDKYKGKKCVLLGSLSYRILTCLIIVNLAKIFNIGEWNLLSYKNVNFEAQIFLAVVAFGQ